MVMTRRSFIALTACCCGAVGCTPDDDGPEDDFLCLSLEDEGDASDPWWFNTDLSEDELRIISQGTPLKGREWRKSDSLMADSKGTIHLGVALSGGRDGDLDTILDHASAWTGPGRANVQFHKVAWSKAHIRIDLKPDAGASRSEIGRRALLLAKTLPTMTLSSTKRFSVQHEFGHALGLAHEHQHPKAGIDWNEDAVFAFYKDRNWGNCGKGDDAACLKTIRANITEAYPLAQVAADVYPFDLQSIMMYPVHKCFLKGQKSCDHGLKLAIKLSDKISVLDFNVVARLYPGEPA